MKLRERIRQLRLYYKSATLFRARLASPFLAWWLPFARAGRSVEILFRSGRTFRMATDHWPLLPSACRLEKIGAVFEFLPTEKRIVVDALTFHTPLWIRNEAAYFEEVLLDDVYGIKGRDLRGKVVIDVGAYVGDTAIAFSRQGATVHAIEPSQVFCSFLRRNVAENGLEANVVVHAVGLAEREETTSSGPDTLRFVEGVEYTLRQLPAAIDLLKLDCEGAEYHLLADPRFLAHLAPAEIYMEYHRGHALIVSLLDRAGYAVTMKPASGPVGLLSARRGR